VGFRYVVIEDHGVVREALISLVESRLGARCVGEGGTAAAGLERALATRPDLILLDLILPDQPGLVLCRELGRRLPSSAVVVLTMAEDAALPDESFAAGAAGYVSKRATGAELIRVVDSVARGERRVSARVAQDREGPGVELTGRERDVLRLIAAGHTNAEAAATLNLGVRTVESHRASVARKLGTQRRADFARMARQWGLIE
jgi:DNA-binding NarL/FixJ family response regulator